MKRINKFRLSDDKDRQFDAVFGFPSRHKIVWSHPEMKEWSMPSLRFPVPEREYLFEESLRDRPIDRWPPLHSLSLHSFSILRQWEAAKQPNQRTSAADKSHLGKKKSPTKAGRGREMSESCLKIRSDQRERDMVSILSYSEQEVLEKLHWNTEGTGPSLV